MFIMLNKHWEKVYGSDRIPAVAKTVCAEALWFCDRIADAVLINTVKKLVLLVSDSHLRFLTVPSLFKLGC